MGSDVLGRDQPGSGFFHNGARVHQGLHAIPAPDPDLIKPLIPSTAAYLIARPVQGGLHHDYRLVA